jgi:hypothetical protein
MNENRTAGTLADVLGLLDQAGLTGTRRRDMVSAINRLCEMGGTTPASMRAEPPAGLSEEPVRLHPNVAALYRRKVAALQDLLESDATRIEAVEIIRSLVDQVVFRPPPETGGIEIELVGDIAGMVHLAQNSNENSPVSGAVHDEFIRSVKVVAGVGFELTTFRL